LRTKRSFIAGFLGGLLGAALVLVLAALVSDADAPTSERVAPTGSPSPIVAEQPNGMGTSAKRSTGSGAMTPDQIYESLSGGVVMVLSTFPSAGVGAFGSDGAEQALGTGFVVDEEGYILTNAHVVDEQGETAGEVTVVFKNDGSSTRRVAGELVGVDVSSDVAVIKVDPKGLSLQPLPLGDSSSVVVGEPVVAIGNPLGYDFSITSGIVSATGRSLQAPNNMTIPNGIQTDAAINQGNSGGPLINGRGKVIGINEQIASQSGGSQGLGFAVPINTAIRSLNQLRETGKVQYAWLGVSGQTLSRDVAGTLGITTRGGALVEEVSPESPAADAGLSGGEQTATVQDQAFTLGGDIIVGMDDVTIHTFDDLIAFLGEKKPGDRITITVERDGKPEKVAVTLRQRPSAL
jgi:S1-C subfamily serine protease